MVVRADPACGRHFEEGKESASVDLGNAHVVAGCVQKSKCHRGIRVEVSPLRGTDSARPAAPIVSTVIETMGKKIKVSIAVESFRFRRS